MVASVSPQTLLRLFVACLCKAVTWQKVVTGVGEQTPGIVGLSSELSTEVTNHDDEEAITVIVDACQQGHLVLEKRRQRKQTWTAGSSCTHQVNFEGGANKARRKDWQSY